MKRILAEAQRTNRLCETKYGDVVGKKGIDWTSMDFWLEDLKLQDKLAIRLAAKKRLGLDEVKSAFLAYYRGFCKALEQHAEQARVTSKESR